MERINFEKNRYIWFETNEFLFVVNSRKNNTLYGITYFPEAGTRSEFTYWPDNAERHIKDKTARLISKNDAVKIMAGCTIVK